MEEKEETESTNIFDEIYKLGLLIFSDDAHDLGKGPFHTPEEIAKGDFPIHHFVYGLLIMGGAVIGKIYYTLQSVKLAQETFGDKNL